MQFKKSLQRIPFWIFCIAMFSLFLTGLIYPEQTDYWLALNGIPIMIMEFISIFSTLLLLLIANKDAEKILNVQSSGLMAGKSSKKMNYWFALICVMIMGLAFSYFFSLWFFVYFVISSAVKYIGFKNIDDNSDVNNALKPVGVQILSLILSVFAAIPCSMVLGFIFSKQIDLMYNFHQELLEKQGHTGFAAIGIFAFWGMIYFIFLIVIDRYADHWESKTGTPFVRTMDNKYLKTVIRSAPTRNFKAQSEIIHQQASKRNGTFNNNLFKNKPCFSFKHKEMNIFVGYQEVPMGGDSFRPETTVKVKFQMAKNIKFLVYSKQIKLMMEWLVGIHKMEVDNHNFNDKFVIKTNDKDFSYNFLNYEVQEKLMDLEDNSFFPVLKITKDTFSLVSRSCLDNEEEYDKLINTSILILDKLKFSGIL